VTKLTLRSVSLKHEVFPVGNLTAACAAQKTCRPQLMFQDMLNTISCLWWNRQLAVFSGSQCL